MNKIEEFIKTNIKATGMLLKEFASRSGPGLRFIRELEKQVPPAFAGESEKELWNEKSNNL